MPAERFRVAAAVYGILRDDDGRVVLLRRAGTSFRHGQLSLPAGHLEGGEDAVAGLVRELREELRVEAAPHSCRLALLLHSAPEDADDSEYFHLFFTVGRWSGEPVIGEPAKCSELRWADPAALPPDVVDYVADALAAVARGETLALRGWH
ncbi:NUDIX domain-containing protein [Dactylosporangium sp. NPDC005555]|uniref:NUDIX domain-containing protein n=1 Tax=Dactylosporangium sp. NPDC005555 TaxID=3154889 RepID=UPI0033A31835